MVIIESDLNWKAFDAVIRVREYLQKQVGITYEKARYDNSEQIANEMQQQIKRINHADAIIEGFLQVLDKEIEENETK